MNEIKTLLMRLPLRQLDGTVRLDLGEGQSFLVDGQSGEIKENTSDSADVILTLSKEDLLAILTGKSQVVTLFTEGKIMVEGDMGLAFRLKEIFG